MDLPETHTKNLAQMSVEVGRLPSILGSEFFRTQVTSYSVSTFEDAVIFVHDVERCVARLDKLSPEVIARVILHGFSQEETAWLLGCNRRTVERDVPDAVGQAERNISGGRDFRAA